MYLSRGQKGTLAGDNRAVFVLLSGCVCVCVLLPPAVTDARLFLGEMWEVLCGQEG